MLRYVDTSFRLSERARLKEDTGKAKGIAAKLLRYDADKLCDFYTLDLEIM